MVTGTMDCSGLERELVGVCKQSLWLVRQQLVQYIDRFHPGKLKGVKLQSVMLCAFNEVRILFAIEHVYRLVIHFVSKVRFA